MISDELSGERERATDVGTQLARNLKAQGAEAILAALELESPEPISHP